MMLSHPAQLTRENHQQVLDLLVRDLEVLRSASASPASVRSIFVRDWWFGQELGQIVVQIFLERREEGQLPAVDLDTCAAVHRWLMDEGHALRLFSDDVGVEVGSLGAEPPLRTRSDFESVLGAFLRVETWEPLENRKKYVMILREVASQDSDCSIVLEEGSHRFEIPLQAIKSAQALLLRSPKGKRATDHAGHSGLGQDGQPKGRTSESRKTGRPQISKGKR